MPEISIIVPVYNVAQYLHKCVDSILAQTFTDFEVILVDDGATDNSGAICDEYARQDPRVRVIHKPNGGLSDARNAGIEAAKAPYLGFIDSDDYISREMFQMLHDDITKEQADLAICGIYDVYGEQEPKKLPLVHSTFSPHDTAKMILEAKLISVHAVNKLYRRELFDHVRYPKGSITEDAAIIFSLLLQCKKVSVNTKQQYYYMHRENTISSAHFTSKDLATIQIWANNEKQIIACYPDLKAQVHTRVCWANFIVLDKIVLSENWRQYTERKPIVQYLKKNRQFILKNQTFTHGRKMAYLGLLVNIIFYRQATKIYASRKYQ